MEPRKSQVRRGPAVNKHAHNTLLKPSSARWASSTALEALMLYLGRPKPQDICMT